jgi:hypothetical protein
MRPATLAERQAFLLALFSARHGLIHYSYVQEKVKFALHPDVSAETLVGALDRINLDRYDALLSGEMSA